MNRQNVTKWCHEFSEGRTDVHKEQRNGRPSLISNDFLQEIEREILANRSVTMRELHHIIPEVSKTTTWSCDEKIRVQKIVRTLGAQNVKRTFTKRNGWVPRWNFSRDTHRKEMSFCNPLWLKKKHRFFTTLLNPSKGHCNGAIGIPPEAKNSELQFQ